MTWTLRQNSDMCVSRVDTALASLIFPEKIKFQPSRWKIIRSYIALTCFGHRGWLHFFADGTSRLIHCIFGVERNCIFSKMWRLKRRFMKENTIKYSPSPAQSVLYRKREENSFTWSSVQKFDILNKQSLVGQLRCVKTRKDINYGNKVGADFGWNVSFMKFHVTKFV